MNKLVLLLVAIFATSAFAGLSVHAPEMKELWSAWKSINNKVYAQSEELKRFTVFVENFIQVATHNNQNADTKLALNQFADLTDEEFKAHYLGYKPRHTAGVQQESSSIDFSILALPESVDWRDKGAVTPVKNQAKCGSCWAFSATGALEGLNFIKTGHLLSFSEQHLVDCEKYNGDDGCNGGFMSNAFQYTSEKGIELEDDYPYKAVNEDCKYDAKKAHHVNTAYKNLTANNTHILKAAIAVQPVSVAVQADQAAFRFHKSGVIKANCGTELNHGILAVGYTTINGEEAFIVKNSWSNIWGNKGFGLISTDSKINNGAGACGILLDNSVPTA